MALTLLLLRGVGMGGGGEPVVAAPVVVTEEPSTRWFPLDFPIIEQEIEAEAVCEVATAARALGEIVIDPIAIFPITATVAMRIRRGRLFVSPLAPLSVLAEVRSKATGKPVFEDMTELYLLSQLQEMELRDRLKRLGH